VWPSLDSGSHASATRANDDDVVLVIVNLDFGQFNFFLKVETKNFGFGVYAWQFKSGR
jgi:hypothetical protein